MRHAVSLIVLGSAVGLLGIALARNGLRGWRAGRDRPWSHRHRSLALAAFGLVLPMMVPAAALARTTPGRVLSLLMTVLLAAAVLGRAAAWGTQRIEEHESEQRRRGLGLRRTRRMWWPGGIAALWLVVIYPISLIVVFALEWTFAGRQWTVHQGWHVLLYVVLAEIVLGAAHVGWQVHRRSDRDHAQVIDDARRLGTR